MNRDADPDGTETVATALWERLDAAGHDACQLGRRPEGWRLRGAAVFDHADMPYTLTYEVVCDRAWRTRRAGVAGWIGARSVAIEIIRTGDDWSLNGDAQPDPAGCVDVDLGFTPATNLLAIRRFDLDVGRSTPAPAAYLSFPELRLERLDQTYHRASADTYDYAAPAVGYTAALRVSASGFVVDYPGLWSGREVPLSSHPYTPPASP